ncbi:MAG: hypothetical protein GTO03_06425, partial [Planctomycetales bacterium]|nr:hypothetical protein [Planctomycetales bacterium]
MNHAMKMGKRRAKLGWLAVAIMWCGALCSTVQACPFCRPVKTTFAEDIAASDIAAVAELVQRPEISDADQEQLPSAELIDSYKATFRVQKVYKGQEHVGVGQTVVAIYTGTEPTGTRFLLRGVEPDALQWAPPLALSARGEKY